MVRDGIGRRTSEDCICTSEMESGAERCSSCDSLMRMNSSPMLALGWTGLDIIREEDQTNVVFDLDESNNSNNITRLSRCSRTHGGTEFKTDLLFTSIFPLHVHTS